MTKHFLFLAIFVLCHSLVHGQSIDLSSCGPMKGCLTNPPGCAQGQCDTIFTWEVQGDKMKIELAGRTDGWVAVGFSNDQLMGEDSVSECLLLDTGTVSVQTSFNLATKGAIDYLNQEAISEASGRYADGFVECSFFRDIQSNNAQIYNLDQAYYLLIGVGPVIENYKGFHPEFPTVTGAKIDITEFPITSGATGSALVRAHGILMMTAWTIFVMTAILKRWNF